jgi:hypothetical protein
MSRKKRPTAAAVRRATKFGEAGWTDILGYFGYLKSISKLGQQADRELTKRAKAKR